MYKSLCTCCAILALLVHILWFADDNDQALGDQLHGDLLLQGVPLAFRTL